MKLAEVLLVDDNPEICLLVSHMLKSIDLTTDCVHTLADALVYLVKNNYPVVLLDNHLPDGLGIDFIKYIKNAFPDSKIVIITAFDNDATKTKAHDMGADFFIAKPFSKATLCEKVTELVTK